MAIEDKLTLGPDDVSGGNPNPTPVGVPNFENTHTYTEQELNDPDAITTTITDKTTPLVVLFGAREGGKTVALIRLVRYLEGQGLFVNPDPLFRPSSDTRYAAICKNFRNVVTSNTTKGGTGVMNFMLVKVSDGRRQICQIVEAPGEHYYDPKDVNKPFPRYLNTIFHMPNRKVWVFLVEKDWAKDPEIKKMYAKRIEGMKVGRGEPLVGPHDKVVFMCTKVDRPESNVQFLNTGYPDIPQLYKHIGGEYSISDNAGRKGTNLFTRYENTNPITRLWRPHNYVFIPFSAGTFNVSQAGDEYFNPGSDYYPSLLWNAIR